MAGKVRKYARIEGSKSTSGSKTFYIWNRSNVSVYWPYLDIPTGFTPLLGWFRSGVGSDPPFNGNTAYEFNNQYCISYNAVHGLVNTSTGGAEANNTRMIVPVPNSGSYIYNIVGYY